MKYFFLNHKIFTSICILFLIWFLIRLIFFYTLVNLGTYHYFKESGENEGFPLVIINPFVVHKLKNTIDDYTNINYKQIQYKIWGHDPADTNSTFLSIKEQKQLNKKILSKNFFKEDGYKITSIKRKENLYLVLINFKVDRREMIFILDKTLNSVIDFR